MSNVHVPFILWNISWKINRGIWYFASQTTVPTNNPSVYRLLHITTVLRYTSMIIWVHFVDTLPSPAKAETEVINEASVPLTDVYDCHLLLTSVAMQPKAEVSRPHKYIYAHVARLLWTSDQAVAEAATHTTHIKQDTNVHALAWFEPTILAFKRLRTYTLCARWSRPAHLLLLLLTIDSFSFIRYISS
jgi:hypothetical protein